MYEDVGASGLGRAGLGGVAVGGAALPATGVELLQIAGVFLLVVMLGVFLLRVAAWRGGQADSE